MAIPPDIIEEAKQRVDHRDLTFDETIHNLEMERRQHQKEACRASATTRRVSAVA